LVDPRAELPVDRGILAEILGRRDRFREELEPLFRSGANGDGEKERGQSGRNDATGPRAPVGTARPVEVPRHPKKSAHYRRVRPKGR
jgi:hypothetical protein